jgi:hypothetical protein
LEDTTTMTTQLPNPTRTPRAPLPGAAVVAAVCPAVVAEPPAGQGAAAAAVSDGLPAALAVADGPAAGRPHPGEPPGRPCSS